MRLGVKIFLTSVLLLAALGIVAGGSLLAVQQLVAMNRGILTEALPAIHAAAGLRDSIAALTRLEARYVALGNLEYHALWSRRAESVAEELDRLAGLVTAEDARARLSDVQLAFSEYQQSVEQEHSLVVQDRRPAARQVFEEQSRPAAERAQTAAAGLAAAIQGAAARAAAHARELERWTWTWVLAAVGGSAVAALAGTAWIAARLTRSLRELAAAAREVAKGSLRDPVRVQSGDEVGDLAEAFNAMAVELRQVDALKEEFFSAISHELRNPLTSIIAAADLLQRERLHRLGPRPERWAKSIRDCAERIRRLVNQIMDVSRLRARLLPLQPQWVDLDLLAERALAELQPQAESKGVLLGREGPHDALTVFGDEERLLQIMVNLLGNAVKFTPPGGTVRLTLAERQDEVELAVVDTGRGIPPEALERIFERYQQAHRGHGGSGLGLALVKGLAEAHAGRIQVESQEGLGTRFSVILPRAGAQALA